MKYSIKKIRFESGERFVNLVNEAGIPLFLPTIWLLTSYRGRGLAFNTLYQAVQSIEVLYTYLSNKGIDLDDRLSQGPLFTNAELDDLLSFLKKPIADIRQEQKHSAGQRKKSFKGGEYVRMGSSKEGIEISSNTALTRITYVRDFLQYCCMHQIHRTQDNQARANDLNHSKELIDQYLKERAPKLQASISERLGLSKEVQEKINELIKVGGKSNPWVNSRVQLRNFLIIRFLLETGMRRGEMLNIMVPDINFQSHTVKVVRRPDNPNDPRLDQPVVKTLSREIPISDKLCLLIREYISTNRNKDFQAKKHGFLFTALGTGSPMAINSLSKVFKVIKAALQDVDEQISPHILRHTWNDNFSDYCDSKKTGQSEEERIRNSIMGWSPNSKMAARYSKRHTREAARKASEGMQRKHWGVGDE